MTTIERVLYYLLELKQKKGLGGNAPITIDDLLKICNQVKREEELERQASMYDV